MKHDTVMQTGHRPRAHKSNGRHTVWYVTCSFCGLKEKWPTRRKAIAAVRVHKATGI